MKDSLARLGPAIQRGLQDAKERRRRRAAEAALRESEVRLRGILDYSPNAVFMKDTSGRYMLANQCYEKLLGMPAEDICGKTDAHLFPPEYAAVYAHNEAQVLTSGAPMQFEEVFPCMGNVHTRLANRFPLFDASGLTEGVCTICTDITARMKQEEALRKTEQLAAAGRLAASIAHEINNPLEGLMNLVFLVQRQPELADQTREMLTMAEQELNRVSHFFRSRRNLQEPGRSLRIQNPATRDSSSSQRTRQFDGTGRARRIAPGFRQSAGQRNRRLTNARADSCAHS